MFFLSATFGAAQSENDLKQYFEGRKVDVKIDMPATKDGIDVFPQRNQPLDYNRYGNLLKQFGSSLREGDQIMITKIKVKKKHIEFQLGGGGYGTFSDETTTSVYIAPVEKSRREKYLERAVRDELDERRRRRMREELNELREERQREDSRNRAEAAIAEELAKRRIQEKRLQSGSRFNIRFENELTAADLTPENVMDALAEFVNFRTYSNN